MVQDPNALLLKAKAAEQSASRGFSFFGGREEKYEAAADLYRQAANAFRYRDKDSKEAGQALEKCAAIQSNNLKEPEFAVRTLKEAFEVYKTQYPKEAVRCLESAVEWQKEYGDFQQPAANAASLALMYETALSDPKNAIRCYELAAERYSTPSLSNGNNLKAADLYALQGDYYKAIELYKKVAQSTIREGKNPWIVKVYLFKGAFCHLAVGDMVATKRALQEYQDMDPSFVNTGECKFLHDLVEIVEAGDPAAYEARVEEYFRINTQDPWKKSLREKIKATIEEKGDDFS